MNTSPAPLQFRLDHSAVLMAYGLPEDRMARVAARRAFVEMKQCFMRAAEVVPGQTGQRLQRRVRMSSEVMELWRLSSALFDALPADHPLAAQHRQEVQDQIDSAFPEGSAETHYLPINL